ncbi:MAG: PAS domain S-box protein [Pseudomonadota bacterium]
MAFHDVTERRRAEQSLRRDEKLLSDFFQNAPVGLHWVGQDGRILRANSAELQLLGYAEEEYIGHHITEFHVDARAIEELLAQLHTDQTLHNVEARLRCKDGSIKHVLISSNVFWEDGKFVHTRCFTRDITEQKLAQQALQRSESRELAILDSALDAIITVNHQGRILDFNPAAETIFGHLRQNVLGKPLPQLIIPEHLYQRHSEDLENYLTGGKNAEFEKHFHLPARRAAGDEFPAELSISRISNFEPPIFTVTLRDITNVKKTQLTQARLAAIVESSDDGIIGKTLDAIVTSWNKGAEQIFGYSAEEMIGQSITKIIPVDRRHEEDFIVGQLRRGQPVQHYETMRITKNGQLLHVSLTSSPIRDADGVIVGASKIVRDITKHKEAENALRESEERFRATFNQAAVGIAVANLEGRFLEANQKFLEILNYDADELNQLTFLDITHPEDVLYTKAKVRRLLAGEITEYSLEKRYLRKDGSVVWSLTTATLLKDAAGKPQRFIGIIEDITKRKQAEDALQDETRILELLNRTGTVLASKLNLQEVLQTVTDAATELSGAQFGAFFYNTPGEEDNADMFYTLSGASREYFDKFLYPRATSLFAPTFNGAAPIRYDNVREYPQYGKMEGDMPDGHHPVRSYLAVPVISRSGDVIGELFFGHPAIGVFSERTERLVVGIAAQATIAIDNARLYDAAQRAAEDREKLLESEKTARTEIERMSAMKDEFLATLSHELRTPLNAILGWSQVLRHRINNEAELYKGLDTITRNARLQSQLIEDLLDMSRITSGKVRLDMQPVEPISFIEAAIETVRPAADAKGIRLEKLLDPAAGPISGDPNRLQQVLWNILSNAVKFTPKDGKVQILLQRVSSYIEISVSDTGVGITPEFLPHVFERFRQADASTTRRYGGLGLGLSIVKHLVELHGGIVTVSSAGEGCGATFSVHLPLAAVHTYNDLRFHSQASDVIASGFKALDLSGIKVLVVDDEADARDLIKRVLLNCDAEVLTASTAAEALLLVEKERPHVLVSDIGMPNVDGFELLKRLRALGQTKGGKIPVIALTAFARTEDRTRALRAGFLAYISKPVEPAELIATVASITGRAENDFE